MRVRLSLAPYVRVSVVVLLYVCVWLWLMRKQNGTLSC